MNRRDALKLLSLAGMSFAGPWPMRAALGQSEPAPYNGPLYVTIQATGGWDVTSFCDPKVNQPGRPIINNWATNEGVRQAGNIPYAPFAGNTPFFEKYHGDMLVVNGIDTQTNSHDAGITHNWSGRLSAGYPSFSAQIASINAPQLPMAYISNGGYSETSNLIRFTRVDRVEPLRNLLTPNQVLNQPSYHFLDDEDLALVRSAQDQRLAELTGASNLLPRQQHNRDLYTGALSGGDGFSQFVNLLPSEDQLQPDVDLAGNFAPLLRQAQLALLAFQAGISMTCDLTYIAFDTHDNHDNLHSTALNHLTFSIDYLWSYAEELGLADRLIVYVASDFSRTPYYNSGLGKDHWPIGSALFMQKNAPWGDRVVGLTDDRHNAIPINPNTLAQDNDNGVIIRPGHMMKALRELAGIDGHPTIQRFPIDLPESFNFMG